ncbi:MAG: argininosuccinate lyase [Alphaproteobacteria bacterium]|nr:argininosuccinate lyase [Alphaproteobacteria bacterium]
MKNDKASNAMWGGRFDAAPSDLMAQINVSIDIDKRLYRQDIAGSLAHAAMLVKQSILTPEEGKQIEGGLKTVLEEIEQGKFAFSAALEDIHMNVEGRLKELIGDVSGRLHTARSRNDQVATDFRLWMRDAIAALVDDIEKLRETLAQKAALHRDTVMPGFTHLQVAQPITFALHLDAYRAFLDRDRGRFADCAERLNECPLGACALAGTSFPIDRHFTAEKLGFRKPVANTLDAVASRDFVLEFLAASAICASHLSRLAEEIILWSTAQFGFIRLSDAYSTGSSIMPQKKNPDAAELIRAKAGGVTGGLMQMLMVMKALPLAYNKDMQEDKPPVFAAFDTLTLCLRVTSGMIAEMTVNKDTMLREAESGYSTATDLADWLVKTLNMPFRQAHHVTGRIVKLAENKACRLDELNLADMQGVEPRIASDIFNVLNAQAAARARIKT